MEKTIKSEILDSDAATLAKEIRSGKISSYEAAKTYITHIKRINHRINGLVEERFDEALQEAKKCDERRKAGKIAGKLFGVPITVKDLFHAKGMRTTSGLVHRADTIESEDSKVVKRLKNEGAIIIGKTNTGVLGLHFESANKYTAQRKTHGMKRGRPAVPAADAAHSLQAAEQPPASDRIFSVRCAIQPILTESLHLKVDLGKVSDAGHLPAPAAHPLQEAMLGIGALSKSVADAELIYSIIAKENPPDINLEKFQLVIPEPKYRVSSDTLTALHAVRAFLKKSFPVLTEADVPHLNSMLTIHHLQILSIDGGKDIWPLAFNDNMRFPIFRTLIKERMANNTDDNCFFLKTMALGKIGTVLFQTNSEKIRGLERKIAKKIEDANRFFKSCGFNLAVVSDTR